VKLVRPVGDDPTTYPPNRDSALVGLRPTRALAAHSGASWPQFLFAVAPLRRKKLQPTCFPTSLAIASRPNAESRLKGIALPVELQTR